jgi:hypothetical protein
VRYSEETKETRDAHIISAASANAKSLLSYRLPSKYIQKNINMFLIQAGSPPLIVIAQNQNTSSAKFAHNSHAPITTVVASESAGVVEVAAALR